MRPQNFPEPNFSILSELGVNGAPANFLRAIVLHASLLHACGAIRIRIRNLKSIANYFGFALIRSPRQAVETS